MKNTIISEQLLRARSYYSKCFIKITSNNLMLRAVSLMETFVLIREFANYEHKRNHKHKRKISIRNQRSMTSFE